MVISLQKQLEESRFAKVLTMIEDLANSRVVLNPTELARFNQLLTGKNDSPWREQSISLTLPSGDSKTLSVLSDPKVLARNILHASAEMIEKGLYLEAAMNAYVGFVLSHVFEDANRHTAVIAAHYFLRRHGIPVSGTDLLKIPAGDLRHTEEVEKLKAEVDKLIQSRKNS